MLETLVRISVKLGVPIDGINDYSSDCDKSKFILKQIEIFIGG